MRLMGWTVAGETAAAGDDDELLTLAREAREELQVCQRYFESVSDPDLVEQAIFLLNAAERRYVYLSKQARERGLLRKEA